MFAVGGIDLDGPVMIAAGVCKTPESVGPWMASAASAVESGSYTPKENAGNDGKLFHPETLEEFERLGYGLNSFGMPNVGYELAADKFAMMRLEKPLIVSIAGRNMQDYLDGMRIFSQCDTVAAIEFNFGCPNETHGGRIISFDASGIRDILNGIYGPKPIWMKVSPYSDPMLLKEIAGIVNESDKIRAVVTCNTFPNAYVDTNAISPNGGLAGLSGPALKPIALGQVVQWRKHLKSDIDVIGVGGIMTGNDIVDFLDAGARAVQIASCAFWSGEPRRLGEWLTADGTSERFQALLASRG